MKTFTLYLDKIDSSDVLTTYCETEKAINNKQESISSTSLASFSFDLYDMGYKMYAVKNGVKNEFYPGMPSIGNKDIRKEHNLERLIKAHYFDKDFERE